MAPSPRLIVLFTFLLAALELARGAQPLICKRNEDCRGKLECIDLEGETLKCDNGRCACINERLIVAAAAPAVVQDNSSVSMCEKDEDCQLVVRCIDAQATCSDGKCRCIKT